MSSASLHVRQCGVKGVGGWHCTAFTMEDSRTLRVVGVLHAAEDLRALCVAGLLRALRAVHAGGSQGARIGIACGCHGFGPIAFCQADSR